MWTPFTLKSIHSLTHSHVLGLILFLIWLFISIYSHFNCSLCYKKKFKAISNSVCCCCCCCEKNNTNNKLKNKLNIRLTKSQRDVHRCVWVWAYLCRGIDIEWNSGAENHDTNIGVFEWKMTYRQSRMFFSSVLIAPTLVESELFWMMHTERSSFQPWMFNGLFWSSCEWILFFSVRCRHDKPLDTFHYFLVHIFRSIMYPIHLIGVYEKCHFQCACLLASLLVYCNYFLMYPHPSIIHGLSIRLSLFGYPITNISFYESVAFFDIRFRFSSHI